MRAVRVIESYHRDIGRDPHEILHDGYWVVICESLKHSDTPKDLAYFAQLNHAQEVYSALREDASLRKSLLSKCTIPHLDTYMKE